MRGKLITTVCNVSNDDHQGLQYDNALVPLLKACAKQKDLYKGSRIHADVLKRGLLKKNIFIGNTLVNMYAKCGALEKAQQVFDDLPVRNVVSWNALIAGYAQHGQGKEAFDCFEQMQHDGFSPNAVTFLGILKACGSIGLIKESKDIHAAIVRKGLLGKNNVLGNALVDMYAKCGDLGRAQQVFDELPFRDVVSWTALIAGYAQHGQGEEALNCFERMQCEGLSPNAVTFLCIVKACGSIGAAEKGREVHTMILKEGLLGNCSLGNALVDMYAKCGLLVKARQVFDALPVRDVVSWTALIIGYAQHELGEEALGCFEQMQREGLSPDAVTFACILKACGSTKATEKGKEIHAEIVREGLLGKDCVLGNTLVDMYAKCGVLAKAQHVFDELRVRNGVSWNSLIAGYAQHGHLVKALECFEQMQHEGLSPDASAFTCLLKACSSIGDVQKGNEIHSQIVRKGLFGKDCVLGSALVDMYAKCGALAKAQQVFDQLPVRDVVLWTSLIAGYAQHEYAEEALNCCERMQSECFPLNAVTLTCILKACGKVGEAVKGKEIHVEIVREGLLGKDIVLGTALIGMYAKCGALAKAQQVFEELPVRTVVPWSVLIAGYLQHGHVGDALKCLQEMQHEGVSPDAMTFLCILSACSYSGLVGAGQFFFNAMSKCHGIIPTLEHHTCMVDLFARGGHFDEAMALIKKLPSSEYLPIWLSLLGACRKWGNVEVGRLAFENVLHLDEKSAAAYVYISNIYAAAGMQEDADKIEAMRKKKVVWKVPGRCWWTDVSGKVYSFCVGDKGHSQVRNICLKLEDMVHKISQKGYCPELQLVSQGIPVDA